MLIDDADFCQLPVERKLWDSIDEQARRRAKFTHRRANVPTLFPARRAPTPAAPASQGLRVPTVIAPGLSFNLGPKLSGKLCLSGMS